MSMGKSRRCDVATVSAQCQGDLKRGLLLARRRQASASLCHHTRLLQNGEERYEGSSNRPKGTRLSLTQQRRRSVTTTTHHFMTHALMKATKSSDMEMDSRKASWQRLMSSMITALWQCQHTALCQSHTLRPKRPPKIGSSLLNSRTHVWGLRLRPHPAQHGFGGAYRHPLAMYSLETHSLFGGTTNDGIVARLFTRLRPEEFACGIQRAKSGNHARKC